MSKKRKRKTGKSSAGHILVIILLLLCVLTFFACVTMRQAAQNDPSQAFTPTQSVTAEQPTAQETPSAKQEITEQVLEIPLCRATTTGENGHDHEVHTYSGFTLCYRETYEEAEWVAYTLTRDELNAVTGRTNDFRADTLISTQSATPADYKSSGYDRGHLAPAADMEWSEKSTRDSFLMSNMTPQAPQFNRGYWKKLEDMVRRWADTFGSVTVVTGPVLEKDSEEYSSIGENKVAVPEYFYKVLLAKVQDGGTQTRIAIAFILPNDKCSGDIFDYAVSIDEVERRTGLDFFAALDDAEEDKLESNIDTTKWR